jgi:uncharacterized protein with ParB-like and HNH nuclease domain
MEVKFSPEQKVINDLFAREVKYIIPEYQRPYSWDCEGKSDRNNQVNSMWDDLYSYFSEGKKETYFLGSMVLIGNGDRVYQVIDGQQRLTTIVLLFAAFKCFIQDIKSTITDPELIFFSNEVVTEIDDLIFDKQRFGAVTIDKKVKIEKSTGFDFDKILDAAINCETFKKDDYKGTKSEYLVVAERYFKNKDFFVEQLKKCFLTNGHFELSDAKRLNEFLHFIKNKISVVRILTDSFDVAYHIFEILNNRGLPLSNKDLFRNFIIREFDAIKNINTAYSQIDPTEKWTQLEDNYELRDEFISRWVESKNARQQQYSAFNDLKEIYNKQYEDKLNKKKIEIFYADIERDLKYFTTIIDTTVTNPYLKAKLNVLLNAGNTRYSLNFLLALWRQFEGREDIIFDVVNAYEIFLLHKILIGRFASGPVYGAISNLSHPNGLSEAIAVLAPQQVKNDLKKAISESNFDNDTGKLLISKWIWIQEAETTDDVIEQKLIFDKATLEHIIPQTPDNSTNWITDFSKPFRNENTYKLGNMTLLTGRQNSAGKNYAFSVKKNIYVKTKLSITQELANLSLMNEQYIETRNRKIIASILKDLSL